VVRGTVTTFVHEVQVQVISDKFLSAGTLEIGC